MKRKRSAYVGFSLMTVSAALIGCERPNPEPARPGPTQISSEAAPTAFASLDECMAQMGRDECNAAFQQARAEHDQTAPRFASQAECEQGWGEGNCEPRPDQAHASGSVFMPILAGFMIGRMMGGRGMFGAPLVQRGGTLYSRGAPVGSAAGFGRSGFGRTSVRPGQAPVQRGGFGQTSSYRGSGG